MPFWYMNVMLIISQKTTVCPGVVFVCLFATGQHLSRLLKHTYKYTKKRVHTAKNFYGEARCMFRQIRDSHAPSQPLAKPAALVTGLGGVLHRNDTLSGSQVFGVCWEGLAKTSTGQL